jgi:hypothetical protein
MKYKPPPVLRLPEANRNIQIFLYGGKVYPDVDRTVSNGAVHVLSLPSFRWHKQATPPNFGRFMHSCNVIGNRQMVVVGGVVIEPGVSSDAFTVFGGSADPWEQGIGIFDMSELEWKASYNASAATYVTPDVVKIDIAENGPFPASWSDEVVENWFRSTGASSTEAAMSKSTKSSSSVDDATIAGGVMGAVVGTASIGVAVWYLLRRRRRQQQQLGFAHYERDIETSKTKIVEAEAANIRHEMDGSPQKTELPAVDKSPEAPGGLFELAAQEKM